MATTNLGKVSVTPKGEYDPLITYERLDIVSHNGGSYIVKQASTGVTPIEGEFYALIAEKGDGGSFLEKSYKTYAAMELDKPNLTANISTRVSNDSDTAKNGSYTYDGTVFTRSLYDSKVVTDKIIADTAIAVQDAINNTAVEGGVLADTFVVVDGNKSQGELNQKTVRTFENVADLVADNKLKAGQYVGTLSYNTLGDNGGAAYLVSSVATEYSIPLANGLHAVFSDSFDIRKFGIVDDPTFSIVQDELLTKMCRYADAFSYVVDFHNFSIKTPQKLFYPTGRGLQHRGIGFHKVHEIKNLKMSHNVGTENQIDGITHLMIKFLSYDDIAGNLIFSNIELDGHIQNYTPTVGESDGGFNGIYVATHDLESTMWGQSDHRIFPLNIYYNNITFTRPCRSYAITASKFKSNKITGRDIKGETVALAAYVYAEHIKFDDVDIVYRDDLHTHGRPLVRSVIHIEVEAGAENAAHIGSVELNDIKARDSNGVPSLAFFTYVRGGLDIGKVVCNNIDGNIWFSHKGAAGGKIGELTINNVNYINLYCNVDTINITNANLRYWEMTNLENNGLVGRYPFQDCTFKKLIIKDSDVYGMVTPIESRFIGDDLQLINCDVRGKGTGSIFKSSTMLNSIRHVNCTYGIDGMSVYSGQNTIMEVVNGHFIDKSTNFLNITNAVNYTNTLTMKNVTSDGVLTNLVSPTNKARINLTGVTLPNPLDVAFPDKTCRLKAVGLSSGGLAMSVPAGITVPANGTISWNIDLPYFMKSGDFTISFSEQIGCIFTTQSTSDLAALKILKVYAQNTTGAPVLLGGKAFTLNFTQAVS